MTLRGIGSYLMGDRLEFKPLTVICGTNGSGKSTWLKALNVLTKSLALNRLPYGFEVSDWDPNDIKFTSAFYHLASEEDADKVADLERDDRFGPPGTVGLEIDCDNEVLLGTTHSARDATKCAAWNLLWAGVFSPKSRVRLRIAHPTYWSDTEPTPHLEHFIELQVNGAQTIRLRGERDALQRFEEGVRYPRRTKPYILEASRSLITGIDDDTESIVSIATVYDLNNVRLLSLFEDVDDECVATLLRLFEERFCAILKHVLDGYFYIGAIRHPHMTLQLTASHDVSALSCTSDRHVGASGEFAWQREAETENTPMRFTVDFPGTFQPDDIDVKKFLVRLSAENREDPGVPDEWDEGQFSYVDCHLGLSRVWDLAEPEQRRQVELLQSSDLDELPESAATTCADFLNSVVSKPQLFDDAACDTHFSKSYDGDGELVIWFDSGNPQLEYFRCIAEADLSPLEFRRRNSVFILNFLEGNGVVPTRWECQFSDYLNACLLRLTGNELQPSYLLDPIFQRHFRVGQWTRQYRGSKEQAGRPAPVLIHLNGASSTKDQTVARVIDPCFGRGGRRGEVATISEGTLQPPRQLSAGFHQVFPIVVQLGLMRPGELIAIENPEVHLHPSLQVRVTEALIDHAKSGRHILIETHSDLVIRRIMRSLLNEDLPQSWVHIYFAGLNPTAQCFYEANSIDFHGSSLEQVKIDAKGRIVNWPAGFLDEDLHESQRLLDIMYGNTMGEANDD